MIYKRNIFDKIMYKALSPKHGTPYLLTTVEINTFMHLNNTVLRRHKLYEI